MNNETQVSIPEVKLQTNLGKRKREETVKIVEEEPPILSTTKKIDIF
jgi:hypothetical protein